MSVFPKMYVLCFIAAERNIFLYSAPIITSSVDVFLSV